MGKKTEMARNAEMKKRDLVSSNIISIDQALSLTIKQYLCCKNAVSGKGNLVIEVKKAKKAKEDMK